jgi:flagellar protein FliO/FliZ
MTSQLAGPLLAFVLILALIPAALWLLKRSPMGRLAGAGNPFTRVVSALSLSPSQRIVTVEVGAGDDRRWLVLGVTPAGISTLHQMPPQADVPATGSAPRGGFAQLLQRQQTGANAGQRDAR